MSCHSYNNKTLIVTSPMGFSKTIYEWMWMNLKKSKRVKHPPSVKEVTYSIYYITYSIGDSIIGTTNETLNFGVQTVDRISAEIQLTNEVLKWFSCDHPSDTC